MRRVQRSLALRAVVALAVSAALSYLAWRAGNLVMLVCLAALLLLVTYSALSLAPDAIAYWRGHYWRWSWRAPGDNGPFWAGTREPRRPRGPLLPSRGAAATLPDNRVD